MGLLFEGGGFLVNFGNLLREVEVMIVWFIGDIVLLGFNDGSESRFFLKLIIFYHFIHIELPIFVLPSLMLLNVVLFIIF